MSKRTAVILDVCISQGSAATHLRRDGRPCNIYTKNLLKNLTVKEFCQSIYICRSYDQTSSVLFFYSQCI